MQNLGIISSMADEYLDIVDEQNKLTGNKELRSVAHSTGLWHRVAHVYFFRKANNKIEFLIHLRSKNKDLAPNCWDTRFGGHIKAGESIATSVINEIKEEVGLQADFSKLIEGEWHTGGKYPNQEFQKPHYFEYNEPLENLSFNDGEVQEVKWLSSEDIIHSLTENPKTWATKKEVFEKILQQLKEKIKI